MNYHPICYFIGHWEGKDFHYVAEVNTRELAEKVAEITGREILSDDDADPVEKFIRDYGNQEPSDTAADSAETDEPEETAEATEPEAANAEETDKS